MTEQTATTQSTTTAIQLPGYGDRKEVKELADRIKMMLPGGTHYTNEEALTLAQIGIAHNLDPFNGEVWLIKDEEKGKVYGALVGIKGHRKHAKVQANYWGDFKRIVDPKDYNAPEGAIVFEYIIRDEKTLEGWTKSLASLLKAGLKLDEATGLIGKAPTTIGLGIWSPGDKTKMKPAQCAMFRAEKDALKRRFDVKFKIEIGGQDLLVEPSTEDDERDLEALEGEYEEVEPTEGEEPRDDAEILEELGFGQKPQ